jgi:hypothetical protein
VPTLYVIDYVAGGRGGVWREMPRLAQAAVARGVRRGVRIANGSDAGGYAWTEPMARELALLVRAGMTPAQAVRAATSVAADLLGQSANVGAVAPGRYADLVAAPGDASRDVATLERMSFVMQGGRVVRGAPAGSAPVGGAPPARRRPAHGRTLDAGRVGRSPTRPAAPGRLLAHSAATMIGSCPSSRSPT